jgi:very-short-patch-repair endonuclease
MSTLYNLEKQIKRRKELRSIGTASEKILWKSLRNSQLGIKFRRQHGIGNYIVDFCAPKIKLVIELDGESHLGENPESYDKQRTEFLEKLGFKVLRFWNTDVKSSLGLKEVKDKIQEEIKSTTPSPS